MNQQPLVAVNIPCYRQLPLARKAVASVLAQSFDGFELTLLDDDASDEYREYVDSLADPRVRYHRNATRLGAMQNMFAAIHAGRGKYTVAFHEDDLLGKRYLEAAVDVLERHPNCGFVACELREFQDDPSDATLSHAWDRTSYDLVGSGAEYLRAIFRGVEPMFGSIVYRRDALTGVAPAHEEFATLVDRPFLLSILERWPAAIIRAPLAWYRRHGEDDGRHRAMTADHILRLFERYRAAFPKHWSAQDESLFRRYAASWLFKLYELTPIDGRPSLRTFLYRAWRRGLVRPSLRGPFGIRRLQRAVLRGIS